MSSRQRTILWIGSSIVTKGSATCSDTLVPRATEMVYEKSSGTRTRARNATQAGEKKNTRTRLTANPSAAAPAYWRTPPGSVRVAPALRGDGDDIPEPRPLSLQIPTGVNGEIPAAAYSCPAPDPPARVAAGGSRMLGFTLNEEQESFRLAVRSFAEKALAPRVEELERTETFPLDLFRELGRLGYLGVGYPEEYGGSGGDMVMRCLLIEEIARVNCGFAAALLAHVGLGCIPLLRFGTDGQKRDYLVPALRGEKLGCWGLSEPNAGSDAASIRTTATRQGDDYVINGSKMFITNG